MSDSVWPHRRHPTRLPRPWDSPGKDTGVGCHFPLQCRKVKSESEVAQSCPTLSDPMDCSLPGSSVHGILKARGLEWGAIAFSLFLVKRSFGPIIRNGVGQSEVYQRHVLWDLQDTSIWSGVTLPHAVVTAVVTCWWTYLRSNTSLCFAAQLLIWLVLSTPCLRGRRVGCGLPTRSLVRTVISYNDFSWAKIILAGV